MRGDDQQSAAREALDRAARDSEALGTSSLARAARSGRPVDADDAHDPAVLWGRRVGRALSVLLALGLAWWLGVQLGWWGP